jgi:cysteine sulfinate desulfinase/cysteine desulfurase-like protein
MGSTCDADQTDPTPVLIAIGLSADHTLAAIRLSQPKLVNIGHALGTADRVINFSLPDSRPGSPV